MVLGVFLGGLMFTAAACGVDPTSVTETERDPIVAGTSAIRTVKYQRPGERFEAPTTLDPEAAGIDDPAAATAARNGGQVRVRVFYPRRGQSTDGQCWQGLVIDGQGQIYPVANGDFVRLSPTGQILNGENDENFFATGGFSIWGALDEGAGKLYTGGFPGARTAAFSEHSEFADLATIEGVGEGGVAVGRGVLAGSIFVTDGIGGSRVHRVTLNPRKVKLFAKGPLFQSPDAIASAPDGTLYVVSAERTPRTLVKITTAGKASVFATASELDGRRMVVVDRNGIVHWSGTRGIDRFRPDGRRLAPLPGPNDKPAFENLEGGAFDPQGNLFVVENFGCKKIYKYTGL
jgi:hypothetical protein